MLVPRNYLDPERGNYHLPLLSLSLPEVTKKENTSVIVRYR
jgi:hypothetical protein